MTSLSAPLVKSDFGSQCKDGVRPRRLGATGGLGLIQAPLYLLGGCLLLELWIAVAWVIKFWSWL